MRVLIADDEAAARRRLRELLERIDPTLEISGEAADGGEALRLIAATAPDLVLLDIRMPGLDGLEAARQVARLAEPPAVIFVTAYDDYALDAFEASAVDYLLKPVREQRLAAALGKARRFTPTAWRALEAALPKDQRPLRHYLCSQGSGGLSLIPLASVLYFRAESKYTTVRTRDGEFLIEDSLQTLEQEFGDRFVRIHRKALVAVDSIAGLRKSVSGVELRLSGVPEALPVSRRHLPSVRARLRQLAETRG
ncbi:LytR/AlgR family response regulator transcription factor [Candidatus Methylocalor cossyra]|uniref:Positive alginate biosynthesis regulatory protein n=1 Tax=Candidatus Methylocalor cossyra TaxID=3108543 RepID=A0ABM9NLM5_9GAMM